VLQYHYQRMLMLCFGSSTIFAFSQGWHHLLFPSGSRKCHNIFLYQFNITSMECFVWHPGIQKDLKTGSVPDQIYLKSMSSNSRDGTLFLQNHLWYYYQSKQLPVKSYILCYSHLHFCYIFSPAFLIPLDTFKLTIEHDVCQQEECVI
jgi:hypothetical protein